MGACLGNGWPLKPSSCSLDCLVFNCYAANTPKVSSLSRNPLFSLQIGNMGRAQLHHLRWLTWSRRTHFQKAQAQSWQVGSPRVSPGYQASSGQVAEFPEQTSHMNQVQNTSPSSVLLWSSQNCSLPMVPGPLQEMSPVPRP